MPHRDWLFRIEDIVLAIRRILDYTRGMDLTRFENSPAIAEAVSYNSVVIGEAANHIPDEVASRHPEIDWRHMRGMRNRLVHEYFGADITVVWQTVQDDLPQVLPRLETILQQEIWSSPRSCNTAHGELATGTAPGCSGRSRKLDRWNHASACPVRRRAGRLGRRLTSASRL